MTKLERECLDAANREAIRLGATIVWAQTHSGKHSQICVHFKNQCRKIALSCTPRSSNQPHWVAQNVRRLVRELA